MIPANPRSQLGAESYLWARLIRMCIDYGARRVLNLGSGHGVFCRELALLGFDVVGCDPQSKGMRRTQLAAPHLTLVDLGVDDDLSILGDGSFDVVISNEVREHLATPRRLPRVAHQLLRPGGRLIVSTPYHGNLKNLALSLTNRWDPHLSSFPGDGRIKSWSRKTLSQLLCEEGFEFRRFVGAGFPFFWKSMILVVQKPRTCSAKSFPASGDAPA